MKKNLIIILFLMAIANNTIAQTAPVTSSLNSGFTDKSEAENKTDASGLKQGKWVEYLDFSYNEVPNEVLAVWYRLVVYKDGLFTGTVREYEINGKFMGETEYLNGKGENKSFYKNGNLQSHCYLINGRLNGPMTLYFENGKPFSEAHYVNNVKYGWYRLFTSEGKEMKSEFVNADTTVKKGVPLSKIEGDNKNGITKIYFPSGQIQAEIPYVESKINGLAKTYYQSGQIWSEIPYQNGIKNGTSKQYHKNGQLSYETIYVNGKIEGSQKKYSEDAVLVNEFIYVNNSIVLMKTFRESGKLLSETPFKDGKIHGVVTSYNEDGSIYTETHYVEGKTEGLSKTYLNNKLYSERLESNGQTIEAKTYNDDTFDVMEYKDGVPSGTTKKYSYDGRLISYSQKENGQYKFYNANGGELYKNNTVSILKGALQIIQQASAYQQYQSNPNAENFKKYVGIVNNNFTKDSDEAIKTNEDILNANAILSSESSASTNGGSSNNSQQAAICAKKSKTEWEGSKEYMNYMKNQSCSKLGYIAQRKQAEILLTNCSSVSSTEDLNALNKIISSLTQQINSMSDCSYLQFADPGEKKPVKYETIDSTPKKGTGGGSAIKAK